MTNFRKSLSLSVVMVLALALCCLIAGQVMAEKTAKTERSAVQSTVNGQFKAYAPGLLPVKAHTVNPTPAGALPDVSLHRWEKYELLGKTRRPIHPLKEAYQGRVNVPAGKDQGGDDIGSAVPLSDPLPVTATGTTDGYNDDYNEGYSSTSPDVVYVYSPTADVLVNITTCYAETSYDTKLYVYQDALTAGQPWAFNDDSYNCTVAAEGGFTAIIEGVCLYAGHDYYIVVDGYGGDFGDYKIGIEETTALNPACGISTVTPTFTELADPPGSADANGGCNEVPYSFDAINVGDVISGSLWMEGSQRDLDWYWHTFTADTNVRFIAQADLPVNLVIWDFNIGDCDDGLYGVADYIQILTPCTIDTIEVCLPAGDYVFFIGGTDFEGYPSCAGPYNYWLKLEGEECVVEDIPDECDDAVAIAGDIVDLAWNTSTATTSGIGAHSIGQDIWYCWTAQCDGLATFSLCGSSFDTKMAVWEGCACPPTTELAWNDDACGLQSQVSGVSVVMGQTYLVQVGGYGSGAGAGILNITVSCGGTTPEGTDCADPIDIAYSGYYEDLNATTCGYLDNYNTTPMGSYDGGEDRLYELVIPTATTVNVRLDPKGTDYTAFGIFSDCPPATLVDGISNSGTDEYGLICLELDAGTYYVMVDTWPSPVCIPDYDLFIYDTTCAAPDNDHCDLPTEVFEGVNGPFGNVGADCDGPEHLDCDFGYSDGGFVCPDVWFVYTMACSGDLGNGYDVDINTCGSSLDTKIAIYYGDDCSDLEATLLACNEDACGLQSQVIFTGVPNGITFLIRVGAYGFGEGAFDLTINCTPTPPPPCNDVCTWLDGNLTGDPACADYNAGIPLLVEGTPIVNNRTVGDGVTLAASADCALFGAAVWEAFTVDTCMWVDAALCGTSPSFGLFFIAGESACPCNLDQSTVIFDAAFPDGPYDWSSCGDGNATAHFADLAPGTYYYPVPYDPAYDNIGPYTLTFTGEICPPYCVPDLPYTSYEYISRVQFNTIDNSSGSDGYTDYTEDYSTLLYRGLTYECVVEVSDVYSSDLVGAWIDWNFDFIFDVVTEFIAFTPDDLGVDPAYFRADITVPITAMAGVDNENTIRIQLVDGSLGGFDPCTEDGTWYGEFEDYRLFLEDLPCGDVNFDDVIDGLDIDYLVAFYFTSGPAPLPVLENGDVNGDCCVGLADIVYLADYFYRQGAEPICLPCVAD